MLQEFNPYQPLRPSRLRTPLPPFPAANTFTGCASVLKTNKFFPSLLICTSASESSVWIRYEYLSTSANQKLSWKSWYSTSPSGLFTSRIDDTPLPTEQVRLMFTKASHAQSRYISSPVATYA